MEGVKAVGTKVPAAFLLCTAVGKYFAGLRQLSAGFSVSACRSGSAKGTSSRESADHGEKNPFSRKSTGVILSS